MNETPDEVVIEVETTAEWAGCEQCGCRAVAHERMGVDIRDLACFGRPARLIWRKRRWRFPLTSTLISSTFRSVVDD